MKTLSLFLLLFSCGICMALTPEQKAVLKSAVNIQKSNGVRDTSALLIALTERKQSGSHQVQTQVAKDAELVQYEQIHVAILAKYGMQPGVAFSTCVQTMLAAGSGKTGDTLTEVVSDRVTLFAAYDWLRQHGCTFDANEGQATYTVTNTVPDYAEPIIPFGINGNDIEEVQR